jgi:hypothetical protein
MRTTYIHHPSSIGDLLDSAFRVYRLRFSALVGIVAILQVPIALVRFLIQRSSANSALPEWIVPNHMLLVWPFFGVSPLVQLFPPYALAVGLDMLQYLVIQNVIIGAVITTVAGGYPERQTTIRSAYRVGLTRLPALIPAIGVLFVIRYMLGELSIAAISDGIFIREELYHRIFLLQIAPSPGDYFLMVICAGEVLVLLFVARLYARLCLAPQAVILEGYPGRASIGRSWQLIRLPFWRTVLIVVPMEILIYLILATPAAVAGFGLGLISTPSSRSDFAQVQVLVMTIAQLAVIIALPFHQTFLTLLYSDLRMRNEGHDLEDKIETLPSGSSTT